MKTSTQFTRFTSLLAFVSLLFLVSCSSNTESPVTGSRLHTLKVGDTFTYHDHTTDTSGVTLPGGDTTITASVTRTGLTVAGKNAVTEIVKGSDTTYLAESGDSSYSVLQNQVGITSGASLPAIWVSFDPSKTGKTVYDSTQNATISGFPATIHSTIVMNYLGKITETVGGNSLTVFKFSKVVEVIMTVMGQDFTTTVTVMNTYAPAIGYLTDRIVKTVSNTAQSPVPNEITYSVLQSYHIQ